MSGNLASKSRQDRIRKRINRLVEEKNYKLTAIAARSRVPFTTVKSLYEQKKPSKQSIHETTAKKLENGLDVCESEAGLIKYCCKCGSALPIGQFCFDRSKPDGVKPVCKFCMKNDRKKKRKKTMNNNKEKAITAEIVRKVKSEDKREIESKFMAPYFDISPKQLDEIRKGIWDKLLVASKQPKRADTVLEAVELLRDEFMELKREIEFIMIDMGIDVEKAKEKASK